MRLRSPRRRLALAAAVATLSLTFGASASPEQARASAKVAGPGYGRQTPSTPPPQDGRGHPHPGRRGSPRQPSPAPPQGSSADSSDQSGLFGSVNPLAIKNPVCGERLAPTERQNCEAFGAPEARYPTSNYGFDINIVTGLTHITGDFQALLAHIAEAIWMASLFVLNLVMTVLGWAFELNPFSDNRAMGSISSGLEHFYRAFTAPWLVVAMVAIGAAGIWRGLIQRQVSSTIAGSLLSVGLIVGALLVIHDPRATVGKVSNLSNKAAQAVIAAPEGGSIAHPTSSYATTTARVWNAMTLPGFVALDFSDSAWALHKPDPQVLHTANQTACADPAYLAGLPAEVQAAVLRGTLPSAIRSGPVVSCSNNRIDQRVPVPRSNAEIWLRNSPGSFTRHSLWSTYGDKAPYSAYLAIQGGDGAWTRLPLVILIGLGLLGGVALLSWLALRIFVQTAMAFVLVLATPLALFLPAFGEAGRRSFLGWATTLLGALVSKLIYAALLSVILFATLVVGGLASGAGGIGAMMSFLVMAALWWAVFLKREELVGVLSIAREGEGGLGTLGKLAGVYAAVRLGRAILDPLARKGGHGARRGSRALAGVGGSLAGSGADRQAATAKLARAQLDKAAAGRLDALYAQAQRDVAEQSERREKLARAESLRSELAAKSEVLRSAVAAAPMGRPRRAAQARLAAHEARLKRAGTAVSRARGAVDAGAASSAGSAAFIAAAEARRTESGRRWGRGELRSSREAIRREVDEPVTSRVHAWRVGMTPERYATLRGVERERAQREVSGQLRADRAAFGAIPSQPAGLPKRADTRRYRRLLRDRDGFAADRAVHAGGRQLHRQRNRSERGARRALPRRGVSR